MQKTILMLIGTQTGNTELVAEEVATELAENGFRVHFVDMLDAYPELLEEFELLIVATSTWGDGELPDNALDFYESLQAVSPNLSHIKYGIIALGDQEYHQYYCAAADLFKDLFSTFGAEEIVAPYLIDAGPTKADIEGAISWSMQLTQSS